MKLNIPIPENLKLSVFTKICPTCGEKFIPANRKKIFCNHYCKHVWHYEKQKLEFRNENLIAAENLKNYKVIKECDTKGRHIISEEGLDLLGYNKNVMAPVVNYKGKNTVVYNCYGLYFENNYFHIIKLSQWKLTK